MKQVKMMINNLSDKYFFKKENRFQANSTSQIASKTQKAIYKLFLSISNIYFIFSFVYKADYC